MEKIVAPQGVSTESEASAQDIARIIRQVQGPEDSRRLH
jgi:ABC-type Zn uptake system ZnuABC Zn-binding protein ZnuA